MRTIISIFLLLAISHVFADTSTKLETSELKINIKARTPEQMRAFYGARGFQPEMINILAQQCFMTIYIKNKTSDILWLDLTQWKFSDGSGEIKRLDRAYWKQRWQQMHIPLSHQSTFRWTLIPETLGYLPDEGEGGNIVLPRNNLPLTIHAEFKTGKDKRGKPINITLNNLECAAAQ